MGEFNYINVKDYGAVGDGVADDTQKIRDAFAAAKALSDAGKSATVFIPLGVYLVGTLTTPPLVPPALTFSASGCKLTGGGTLKHINVTGYDNGVVLAITGDRNVIEWLRIDGGASGGALTSTDGYRVSGKFNRTMDVYVFNVAEGPGTMQFGGSSFAHLGTAGTLRRCTTVGGYEGLRDGGDFNIMRDCLALNYRVKGYNSAAATTWSAVIGVHAESIGADATCSFQIDSEDPIDPKYFGRANFRDCTSLTNHSYPGTTAATKFTWIRNVYVSGCAFVHSVEDVTTFRLAGSVGRCRVKETFLSQLFHFQVNSPVPPEQVRLESVEIGDGTHSPLQSIEHARSGVFVMSDSVLQKFTRMGIEWWGADGTYSLLAATNCEFNGERDVDPVYDIARFANIGSGQLNRSRRIRWLGNRRANSGTGSALFTQDGTPTLSSTTLGSTRDASIQVYAETSAPSGGNVTWSGGDNVANNTPTSGGYYGWVCTASGAPGTWKQWGAIA